MFRRTAYLTGLFLGSVLTGWLLGAALTYFLTGKLISWQQGPQGIQIKLQEVNTYHLANPGEAG